MHDARDYFRKWVLSLPGVTALVGDRVFCDPLPEGETFPALTYLTESTPAAEGFPMQDVVATVWCFGSSESAARGLFLALVGEVSAPGASQKQVEDQVFSGLEMVGSEKTKVDTDRDDFWFVECKVQFSMDL